MRLEIDFNRRICYREGLRIRPVRCHTPLMQEARSRQNERTGANRRYPPRPRRHRTYPFDKGRIHACLLGLCATHHDQSIQTVLYLGVTVGRDELYSARRLDRSRGRGNDITLVAGFAGSPIPLQQDFRIKKHIDGSADI